jgi:hypothetical protein
MPITPPTKDQVRKLTPEQQDVFGAAEVQRIRSRYQVLERAHRGMTIGAGLLVALASGLAMLCIAIPRLLPLALIAVIALVTYHATRLHRRLDALAKLHDLDIKRATEKKDCDDDRVT